MFSILSSAVLGFIEKELLALEPAVQAEIMSELSKISAKIIDCINAKLGIESGDSHG